MGKVLVIAGIFLVATIMLVIGFRVSNRKIEWVPLLWAGFAFLVYVVLLKSRDLLPIPVYLEAVPLIWFGKILSLSGTIAILYFLPRASFRSAGLTWTQNEG